MSNPSAVPMPFSPQQRILTAIMGFLQSRAIAAAAELGLADLLAGGPLHVDALSELSKTHSRSLFRLMRALESEGIFTQVSPQVFANTPVSECLRTNVPGSLRSSIRAALSPGHGEYDAWSGFEHSLRTGKPAFDHLYGCDFWTFLKRNPDESTLQNESQQSYTALSAQAVAAGYDWGHFPVIADIGGGTGAQLEGILDRYTSCRGILFDLPEVVAEAPPHVRMERIGGNFFDSVPPGADAYLLRAVLHAWTEPQAITILTNIRKVIGSNGRVVLVETVVTDSQESTMANWVDLQMLVVVGGAKRTVDKYRDIFNKSGFDLEDIASTESSVSILTGSPR